MIENAGPPEIGLTVMLGGETLFSYEIRNKDLPQELEEKAVKNTISRLKNRRNQPPLAISISIIWPEFQPEEPRETGAKIPVRSVAATKESEFNNAIVSLIGEHGRCIIGAGIVIRPPLKNDPPSNWQSWTSLIQAHDSDSREHQV